MVKLHGHAIHDMPAKTNKTAIAYDVSSRFHIIHKRLPVYRSLAEAA
jgi:hypothetical protein